MVGSEDGWYYSFNCDAPSLFLTEDARSTELLTSFQCPKDHSNPPILSVPFFRLLFSKSCMLGF